MEIKIDEWEKSQNVSLEQPDRTDPPPPPQAYTEQVNVVFIGSGKSDDSPKTQKDSPPPIIVNNKIRKDKPIKTSKRDYQVVKTNEYPFLVIVKRLCLVDDLKMLKITMSNTSSRNKLNPEINDHYNILTGECQKDELKTKDKA
ncbi:hypothetical protein Tco_0511963 [Tanacetum coccineum]